MLLSGGFRCKFHYIGYFRPSAEGLQRKPPLNRIPMGQQFKIYHMRPDKYDELLGALVVGERVTRHDFPGISARTFADLEAKEWLERDEDGYWRAGPMLRMHWNLDEDED